MSFSHLSEAIRGEFCPRASGSRVALPILAVCAMSYNTSKIASPDCVALVKEDNTVEATLSPKPNPYTLNPNSEVPT